MRLFAFLVALLVGEPLAVARDGVAPAELRIVGTDLLGLSFSQAVYDFAGKHDLRVALALDGSRPGLDTLKAARAHLALLVLPVEEEGALRDFGAVTIGYHRVMVVAPAACPLERVTVDQLGNVFGDAAKGERWADLGVEGEWCNLPVTALLPEVGSGIAAAFFRHAVLHDRPFRSTAGRYRDWAALRTQFKGEIRSLALVAQMPDDMPEVKVLALAADARSPAFLPTVENLQSGKYPLRLPLRAVFRLGDVPKLRPLLEFLTDSEVAPLLDRAGIVPAPAAAGAQQLAALGKM
jgi:phosphate transport system substrate-binding protein